MLDLSSNFNIDSSTHQAHAAVLEQTEHACTFFCTGQTILAHYLSGNLGGGTTVSQFFLRISDRGGHSLWGVIHPSDTRIAVMQIQFHDNTPNPYYFLPWANVVKELYSTKNSDSRISSGEVFNLPKWSCKPSTFQAKSLRTGEKNPHKLYIVRMLNACTLSWCQLANVCMKYVFPDNFFTF